MKTLRKLIALCAAMALLMTLWMPAAVSAAASEAAAEEFYFGRSILSQMPNSEALCFAYDRFVTELQELQDTVSIEHATYRITRDEAVTVYNTVLADHPELYWVADGLSMSGYADRITALRTNVPADAAEKMAQVEARVAELTAGLEQKSDYDKSLILHDRLCDAVVYDMGPNNQTVVGSLLDGRAVCAGYARGYQLLMQAVGIPIFYVSGVSKGVAHAWNLVQLEGEWYYTDVTWDDQNDDGSYDTYHAYLNNTFAQMEEDHTAQEFVEYLPHSTATALNYHVKTDRQMAAFDVARLADILRRGNPGSVYVTGDLQDFMNDLQSNVRNVATALASDLTGYSMRYSYMGRELLINLTVKHSHSYEDVIVESTCTADGSFTTICSQCGLIDRVVILPATGHDLFETGPKEPTCQEEGWEAYEACLLCDYTTYQPLTGECHYEVAEVVTPTCRDGGYTRYACVYCGDSYEDDFTPVGDHDFSGVWEYNDQFHYVTCAYCDDIDGYDVHHFGDDHLCDVCGYATAPAFTYGDVNDDGRINNRDLGLLQQYLADWEVTPVLDACDVNKDGRINNRDLGLLQQYLADWGVTLG